MDKMSQLDALLKVILRLADAAETLNLSASALAKAEKVRHKAAVDTKKAEHEKWQEVNTPSVGQSYHAASTTAQGGKTQERKGKNVENERRGTAKA
jgi:hypothetical protein